MNWRRILAITALGGWLIFVGGILWLGPRSGKEATFKNFGVMPSKATIVIQLKSDNPKPEGSRDCGSIDVSLLATILRSQLIGERVDASLDSTELKSILGKKFLFTAIPQPRAIRIKVENEQSRLVIMASHHDPQAAQLIAMRLYEESIKYVYANLPDDGQWIVSYLKKRRRDLVDEIA